MTDQATADQAMSTGQRPGLGARLLHKLAGPMFKVSPGAGYRIEKGLQVPTRDGCRLMADHFMPVTRQAFGTVLVRSPYGRAFPNSLVYGAALAGAGYHVLVESVRGTFGSTGSFEPFIHEANDAQDTVAWLREQDWFDGNLATVGGSYLGLVQWALLADPPPELRASIIVVGPHSPAQSMFGTGSFALATWYGWSEAIANQEKLGHIRGLAHVMSSDKRAAPVFAAIPHGEAAVASLEGGASWYTAWLDHPDPEDSYWDAADFGHALSVTQVPTLLVGGWQDLFLEQTIAQYDALKTTRTELALTVGPWTHVQTATKAAGEIGGEAEQWLRQHLRGDATSRRPDPVRVFVTGADTWKGFAEWPPAGSERVLHTGDRGTLEEVPGTATTSFVYDPGNPTPSVGGRLLSPRLGGSRDNRQLEDRPDVVTFTSSTLDSDLEVIGAPVLEIAISLDNPHADLFARLCDVDARGRSKNFSDAYVRLDPGVPAGQVHQISLRMDPCAHRLAAGHRLRLVIAGGAHPRFARNLGTGERLVTGRRLAISNHTIHHADTRILLPIGDGR
jgi:putative CocE/NonD family hydrolase